MVIAVQAGKAGFRALFEGLAKVLGQRLLCLLPAASLQPGVKPIAALSSPIVPVRLHSAAAKGLPRQVRVAFHFLEMRRAAKTVILGDGSIKLPESRGKRPGPVALLDTQKVPQRSDHFQHISRQLGLKMIATMMLMDKLAVQVVGFQLEPLSQGGDGLEQPGAHARPPCRGFRPPLATGGGELQLADAKRRQGALSGKEFGLLFGKRCQKLSEPLDGTVGLVSGALQVVQKLAHEHLFPGNQRHLPRVGGTEAGPLQGDVAQQQGIGSESFRMIQEVQIIYQVTPPSGAIGLPQENGLRQGCRLQPGDAAGDLPGRFR